MSAARARPAAASSPSAATAGFQIRLIMIESFLFPLEVVYQGRHEAERHLERGCKAYPPVAGVPLHRRFKLRRRGPDSHEVSPKELIRARGFTGKRRSS